MRGVALKPDQLTTDQLRALAVAHVRRFDMGVKGRNPESERRRAIWKAVLSKANHAPQWRLLLSDEERREVQFAVDCGEFDGLLRTFAERPS